MKFFFATAVSFILPITAYAGSLEADSKEKVIVSPASEVVAPVPLQGFGFGGLGPAGAGLIGLGIVAAAAAASGGSSNGTTGTNGTD